jgi:ribosomal-protein-serine acetyltransferase
MFCRTVAAGVEIRLCEEQDAERTFALVDRNRDYLRQWLPWVDRTHSAEDSRQFARLAAEKHATGDELHAAIWANGEIAGGIGHHAIDWANRNVSIGYWVAQRYQGLGLVTRSVRVLLDYLFDERGLHRVEIRCGTGNVRSCAVPQRLGFTREGVIREAQWVDDRWIDLVVWGILDYEWRKQ